jgi:predicted RNA binding protein YcfA (HicA-like mRNA interferase family)
MAKKAKREAKPAKPVLERNSKKILKRLEQDGWKVVSIEGSHHKLRNPKFNYPIILVHPKKDLPTGTARKIAKDAGWL